MKLVIENVRCLSGRSEIELRPLTVLVGENSSGKTTLLSAIASVFDPPRFPFTTSFNEPPFSLGNFDTIATYRGGRGGRSTSFTVGYSVLTHRMEATFGKANSGLPQLVKISVESYLGERKSGSLSMDHTSEGVKVRFTNGQSEEEAVLLTKPVDWFDLLFALSGNKLGELLNAVDVVSPSSHRFRKGERARALAPVRAKPQRTYDQPTDNFSPEGDEIPLMLAEFLGEGGPSKERDALFDYGIQSGLFRSLRKRSLGSKAGSPFQILVKNGAQDSNLVDVGYGVSQVLPVVMRSLQPEAEILLLQQPEVHLHPRAQAALGSVFCKLCQQKKSPRFIIETHSDYLVDRLRIEASRGNVDPSKVLILYFERENLDAKIFPIELDKLGNLIGAPDSYREFFLREFIELTGGVT